MKKALRGENLELYLSREPELEGALGQLLRLLSEDKPSEDILLLVDYLEPFLDTDNDPRSMGWVGSDGLP